MVRNQLTMQEARKLFDYRDGTLFWRHAGSGRRADLRAVTVNGKQTEINIGGVRYQARYLVWNWHHGITSHQIVPSKGNPLDTRIENLREIEVVKFISVGFPSQKCPCCAQSVPVPTASVIAENCGLTPIETKILEAVWSGGGRPVQTDLIFQRMFENDPDGGPTPQKMYLSFKVALSHLRGKLRGSGVAIENMGYRGGYRLVIGAAAGANENSQGEK